LSPFKAVRLETNRLAVRFDPPAQIDGARGIYLKRDGLATTPGSTTPGRRLDDVRLTGRRGQIGFFSPDSVFFAFVRLVLFSLV
jgi:hypothetical protein